MKTILGLAALLTPLVAVAQESPALAFLNAKIESGPLSLLDAAKEALPPIFGKAPMPNFLAERRASKRRPVISNMGIVKPDDSVEFHMNIVKPDESVDYKLIIKKPDVESSK